MQNPFTHRRHGGDDDRRESNEDAEKNRGSRTVIVAVVHQQNDDLLDERGIAALSPFDRADFDAHVARCPDCAAQRLASERLLSFRPKVPALPPGLVERALESGAIDEATKRELLAAVAHRGRRPQAGVHPIFVLGWVGLFAGLGMIGISLEQPRWWPPAILVTAISFGVLSVPLAAREMQSRKHA